MDETEHREYEEPASWSFEVNRLRLDEESQTALRQLATSGSKEQADRARALLLADEGEFKDVEMYRKFEYSDHLDLDDYLGQPNRFVESLVKKAITTSPQFAAIDELTIPPDTPHRLDIDRAERQKQERKNSAWRKNKLTLTPEGREALQKIVEEETAARACRAKALLMFDQGAVGPRKTHQEIGEVLGKTGGFVARLVRRAQFESPEEVAMGHVNERTKHLPRGKRALTPEQECDVAATFDAGGVSKAALARKYGVAPQTIKAIIDRERQKVASEHESNSELAESRFRQVESERRKEDGPDRQK